MEHVDKYKKVLCPKVLNNKNSKHEIMNHLYFGANFIFWVTSLGRFTWCFLLTFHCRPTMVANIFAQAPIIYYTFCFENLRHVHFQFLIV